MNGGAVGGCGVGGSHQLVASTPSSSQTTQGQTIQAQQQQPPQPHQLSGSSSSSHRRSPVSTGLNPAAAIGGGSSQNNSMGSLAAPNSSASSAPPGGPTSSTCCGNTQMQTNSVNQPTQQTVVAYYFCNETIPYRTTVPYKNVTLGQFKALLTRRGRFRLESKSRRILFAAFCIKNVETDLEFIFEL